MRSCVVCICLLFGVLDIYELRLLEVGVCVLTQSQIDKVRSFWAGRPELLGAPDAEKDVNCWPQWESSIFLPLDRFRDIHLGRSQLVIGRKGSGKSAGRIAAERKTARATEDSQGHVVFSVSADRLIDSAISEFQIREQAGAAVVPVWYKIYAAEFLKEIATKLSGKPLLEKEEVAVRKWAVSQGFAVEDFGERLVEGARQLFPMVRERVQGVGHPVEIHDDYVNKLLKSKNITLFVDNFDNPGDPAGRERLGMRNVQAAIEAADLLTSHYSGPNVSLLIREDLWLRCRVGWHYLDKVSRPLWLEWNAQELKNFLQLRLIAAVATALDEDISVYKNERFNALWDIFFPETITLQDGSVSQGFTYVVRRTMYTPRDVQTFLQFAISESTSLPLGADHIQKAEEKYSIERMQYVINEFGTMCEGLSQCLHSFAGHSLEWGTSEMRKHLNGQMCQGTIRPREAACQDVSSPVDLMRFLFRIGFLEVRIPNDSSVKDGPYEVRDGLRHPDHWSGARVDDSVKWAVRSTFYQALQSYRADFRSAIGSGRKAPRW